MISISIRYNRLPIKTDPIFIFQLQENYFENGKSLAASAQAPTCNLSRMQSKFLVPCWLTQMKTTTWKNKSYFTWNYLAHKPNEPYEYHILVQPNLGTLDSSTTSCRLFIANLLLRENKIWKVVPNQSYFLLILTLIFG